MSPLASLLLFCAALPAIALPAYSVEQPELFAVSDKRGRELFGKRSMPTFPGIHLYEDEPRGYENVIRMHPKQKKGGRELFGKRSAPMDVLDYEIDYPSLDQLVAMRERRGRVRELLG